MNVIQIYIFRYEILDHIAHWAKDVKEIERAYILMDEQLKKILDIINDYDHVIIVSDHGIQRKICDRRFFINSWLRNQNLLRTNKEIRTLDILMEKFTDFAITYAKIDRITLSRIYTKFINLFLSKKGSNKSFTQIFLDKINFKDSKAFAYNTSAGGFTCVCVKDRKLLPELENKLKNIVDPTGIKPVKRIYKRVTKYGWIELVIEAHEKYIFNHEITHSLFKIGLKSFKHSMNGVFIMFGSNVQKNNDKIRSTINICDVAPTIFYLLRYHKNYS